jgi:hypothetical protein
MIKVGFLLNIPSELIEEATMANSCRELALLLAFYSTNQTFNSISG